MIRTRRALDTGPAEGWWLGQAGAPPPPSGQAPVGAPVAMACKFLDRPGEQLMAYYADGIVRVWGDRDAQNSELALARYAHPFYRANQRTTANSNHNCITVAGI